MVLWELTLATAYWLGLGKTYKLALKLQRRLIGPQHPRVRDFVHRRTRNVFDVALTVHKEIQKRDLSAGKSLGNFILRMLDRMRPSAHIRCSSETKFDTGQGKLLSGRTESDRTRSDARHVSGTSPAGGKKSEAGTGSVHGKLFASQQAFGSQFGLTIKNKISVGLDRIKPGIGRFKPGPGIRTLPGVALGLWWQPVREKLEASHPRSSSSVPGLPAVVKFSQEHYKSSSPGNGIIREDIAKWMHAFNQRQQGAIKSDSLFGHA